VSISLVNQVPVEGKVHIRSDGAASAADRKLGISFTSARHKRLRIQTARCCELGYRQDSEGTGKMVLSFVRTFGLNCSKRLWIESGTAIN
jgi:hypothetical protein